MVLFTAIILYACLLVTLIVNSIGYEDPSEVSRFHQRRQLDSTTILTTVVGNYSSIATSSDGAQLVAIFDQKDIYTSIDSEQSWVHRFNGGDNLLSSVICSGDGTKLVAIAATDYIYTSNNSGVDWNLSLNATSVIWRSIASSSDGTRLVAIGSNINIRTSNDSGITWTERLSAGIRVWSSVAMSYDGNIIVARSSGINGTIFVSMDFGTTWAQRSTIFTSGSLKCSSDCMRLVLASLNGYIYTSDDLGITWIPRKSLGSQLWRAVTISSDGLKVAAISVTNYIYTSNDGGITWLPQAVDRSWYYMASTSDGNTLYCAFYTSILVFNFAISDIPTEAPTPAPSQSSMAPVRTHSPSYEPRNIFLQKLRSVGQFPPAIACNYDGSKVVAVTPGDYIYTSIDYGVSWIQRTTVLLHWGGVSSNSNGTVLIAAESHQLYTSHDSGVTWIARLPVPQVSGNGASWFSVTISSDGSKMAAAVLTGYIFMSYDSGVTWTQITSAGFRIWYSITSNQDFTILAAAAQGIVYTSSDAGVTWVERVNTPAYAIYSMTSSLDGTKLALASIYSYIYISNNSGVTWEPRSIGINYDYSYFISSSGDGNRLAAIGSSEDYIYTSEDSGVTWEPQIELGLKYWDSVVMSKDGLTYYCIALDGVYRPLIGNLITDTPTSTPSYMPTLTPTILPTSIPTDEPTLSLAPTSIPSNIPTFAPSITPTSIPSNIPTLTPSITPTSIPSNIPTLTPSITPTSIPSNIPTLTPSITPTSIPSNIPTLNPSLAPSPSPTLNPSNIPTIVSTRTPSAKPSRIPTSAPTYAPTFPPVPISIPDPVVILSRQVGGICDNLILDASQSTGGPFQVVIWSVTKDAMMHAVLTTYLNSVNDISKPIVVSNSILSAGYFEISLQVRNFNNHQASTMITFTISPELYTPLVRFSGADTIIIPVSDTLFVTASATLSACSDLSIQLRYDWVIYDSNNHQLPFTINDSKDAKQFIAVPYGLSLGSTYNLTLTVSSLMSGNIVGISSISKTIVITNSIVSASVIGGYIRQTPIDQSFTLDARESRDLSYPTNGLLYYTWTCVAYVVSSGVVSTTGSSCSLQPTVLIYDTTIDPLLYVDRGQGLITISSNTLQSDIEYRFQVYVYSLDKTRNDTKTVTVTTSPPGSPTVYISTDKLIVSEGQPVTIVGTFKASFPIRTEWSMYVEGVRLPMNPLTPVTSTFSVIDLDRNVTHNLLATSSSLVGGRYNIFRLTAAPLQYLSLTTYSEVSIFVARLPVNGHIDLSDTTGIALETYFTMYAIDWISPDPSGYPLSYAFYYQLSPDSPLVTLSAKSSLSYVNTTLPPGYSSYNHSVTIVAYVYNALGGYSVTTTSVTVVVNPQGTNIQNYVSTNIQTALNTLDYNIIYQTVGAAAAVYNSVSCTDIDCTILNRLPCTTIPNTCGSCLEGYEGIFGPGNTPCSIPGSLFEVASGCTQDSDCITHTCIANQCVYPMKSCPSNSTTTICSSVGSCLFYDAVGDVISNCTVNEIYCHAKCVCWTGYGGLDCSLSTQELSHRDEVRNLACSTIGSSSNNQNPSPSLVESAAASLSQIYSPSEIQSENTLLSCFNTLTILTSIAAEGNLYSLEISSATSDYLNTIALFALPPNANSNTTTTTTSTSIIHPEDFDRVLLDFQTGYYHNMVVGQTPVELISSNPIADVVIKVQLHYDYIHAFDDVILTIPTSQADYNLPQPSINMPTSGLESLNLDSNMVKVALSSFSQDLYSNNKNSVGVTLQVAFIGVTIHTDTVTSLDTSYNIILPFTKTLSLDTIGILSGTRSNRPIFEVPICNIYNPTIDTVVPYSDCDIIDISNTLVTYLCKDIRKLTRINELSQFNRRGRKMMINPIDISGTTSIEQITSFELTSTVNNEDKDYFSTGMSPAIFSAILTEVSDVFMATMTMDLSQVNYQEAQSILAFISTLVFVIIIGLIYFSIWDRRESSTVLHRIRKDQTSDHHSLDNVLLMSDMNTNFSDHNPLLLTSSVAGTTTVMNPTIAPLVPLLPLSASETSTPTNLIDNSSKRMKKSLEINDSNASEIIKEFVIHIFPDWIFKHQSWWQQLKDLIWHDHDYMKIFVRGSFSDTRMLRYLSLIQVVLACLFFDTLFYQISYPNSNVCTKATTSLLCEIHRSSITSQPICLWNTDTEQCTFESHKLNFFTSVLLVLVVLTLSLLACYILRLILVEVLTKRPEIGPWTNDPNEWLGPIPSRHDIIAMDPYIYQLNELFDSISTQVKRHNRLHEWIEIHAKSSSRDSINIRNVIHTSGNNNNNDISQHSDMVSTEHGLRPAHLTSHSRTDITSSPRTKTDDSIYTNDENNDSIEKETQDFISRIKSYLHDNYLDLLGKRNYIEYHRNIAAIMHRLGLYPDGSDVSMALYDRLLYGTPEKLLYMRIKQARMKAKCLLVQILSLQSNLEYYSDLLLLNAFVEEQLLMSSRYAYEDVNILRSNAVATIHPLFWVLGWIIVIGVDIFFVVFVLLWALNRGASQFDSWILYFILTVIQDFAVLQALQLVVKYKYRSPALREQLLRIYTVLIHATEKAYKRLKEKNKMTPRTVDMDNSRIHSEDENENGLNTSTSIHSIVSELRLTPHISITCRAAQHPQLNQLSASYILNEITDYDIECCKQGRTYKFTFIAFITILLPATLSLLFPSLGELFIQLFIPLTFSSYLLLNDVILSVSFAIIIIIYIVIFISICYYIFIYRPAKNNGTINNLENIAPSNLTIHVPWHIQVFHYLLTLCNYSYWMKVVQGTLNHQRQLQWKFMNIGDITAIDTGSMSLSSPRSRSEISHHSDIYDDDNHDNSDNISDMNDINTIHPSHISNTIRDNIPTEILCMTISRDKNK